MVLTNDIDLTNVTDLIEIKTYEHDSRLCSLYYVNEFDEKKMTLT